MMVVFIYSAKIQKKMYICKKNRGKLPFTAILTHKGLALSM
jgi:hypothetical protein